MCKTNVHAGLFGTFCFSKGKRSFCLSLLKLQNVPNKPACMFIWHIIEYVFYDPKITYPAFCNDLIVMIAY